jgi:signal transduction histidine kinase
MKISTRLSLTFSAIASAVFLAFGITIYFFSSNYQKNDFQERLKERVIVTEKMFLEKETFSSSELNKISDQFLHTLPQETEEVIEIVENEKPIFYHKYPAWVKKEALSKETLHFHVDNVQGMSRIFQVKGKEYLIIVTAVDEVGLQNLSFLRRRIFLLILIGIPLIFIGGFILTKRALQPLSKKIANANTIGASNLHQRLKVYNPNDEIGKLAIAFNNLLDRLELSFEAQKSFISNASHEIKNPLTAIIGEAEVTLSKARNEKAYKQALKTILIEAEKLNTTSNNLLQLSKIRANEGNVRFEFIKFGLYVSEIKRSFDFFNPENNIVVNTALDSSGLDHIILGNRELLKVALINLLDNACKFSYNNEVVVSLMVTDNFFSLKIQDNGIGIANEDLEKIKTPFHRGNNALKIAGSGIGLSLSSKIIEIHKGTLDIQSKIEIGTLIQVRIPLFFA